MARDAYKSEKRRKELERQKKQAEKREKRLHREERSEAEVLADLFGMPYPAGTEEPRQPEPGVEEGPAAAGPDGEAPDSSGSAGPAEPSKE